MYCCLVGANLLIEEAKVEFPNGKDALKVYAVCGLCPLSKTSRLGIPTNLNNQHIGSRYVERNPLEQVLLRDVWVSYLQPDTII